MWKQHLQMKNYSAYLQRKNWIAQNHLMKKIVLKTEASQENGIAHHDPPVHEGELL